MRLAELYCVRLAAFQLQASGMSLGQYTICVQAYIKWTLIQGSRHMGNCIKLWSYTRWVIISVSNILFQYTLPICCQYTVPLIYLSFPFRYFRTKLLLLQQGINHIKGLFQTINLTEISPLHSFSHLSRPLNHENHCLHRYPGDGPCRRRRSPNWSQEGPT